MEPPSASALTPFATYSTNRLETAKNEKFGHFYIEAIPKFFSTPEIVDFEGIECSVRAENIINRKITIFYIEAISKKKVPTSKKIVFV